MAAHSGYATAFELCFSLPKRRKQYSNDIISSNSCETSQSEAVKSRKPRKKKANPRDNKSKDAQRKREQRENSVFRERERSRDACYQAMRRTDTSVRDEY